MRLKSDNALQCTCTCVCYYFPCRYFTFSLDFETYYPQAPQKPRWVNIMCEEIIKLQPKRQMNENNIYEVFRKCFGTKKAIKYKVVPSSVTDCEYSWRPNVP